MELNENDAEGPLGWNHKLCHSNEKNDIFKGNWDFTKRNWMKMVMLATEVESQIEPLAWQNEIFKGNWDFIKRNWMKMMMLATEVESQIEPLEWQNDNFRGNWDFTKRNGVKIMLKGTCHRMTNWAGSNSPPTHHPVLVVTVLIVLQLEVSITGLKLSARDLYP